MDPVNKSVSTDFDSFGLAARLGYRVNAFSLYGLFGYHRWELDNVRIAGTSIGVEVDGNDISTEPEWNTFMIRVSESGPSMSVWR